MAVSVERLMRQLEEEVRAERRARLVARGGPAEYEDAAVFEAVDALLRRAVDARNPDVLLVTELLGDEESWRLQLPLRFATHRPVIGPALLFFKRTVLLPLTRWLYEYSLENFRRQERVNRLLFA